MLPRQEKILNEVAGRLGSDKESGRIMFINGIFGTGKSYLAGKITQELVNRGAIHLALKPSLDSNPRFLCEIINSFKIANDPWNPEAWQGGESRISCGRFVDLVREIRSYDTGIFESIYNREATLSIPEYICHNTDNGSSGELSRQPSVVEQSFKKKSDQRLLNETGKVLAESLIVDILNYFGNNLPSEKGEGGEDESPKRVLLLFDDVDYALGTILCWLDRVFLEYCYHLRLGDFISYDTNRPDKNKRISELLDFHIMITSRMQPPAEYTFSDRWTSLLMPVITLGRLKPEETELLADELFAGSKFVLNEIQSRTLGLPLLIKYYAELLKEHDAGEASRILIINAFDEIKKHLKAHQRDWVLAASCLVPFTESALRIFPEIGAKYKEVFIFLKFNSDIFNYDDNTHTLSPEETYRHFIREYLSNNSDLSHYESPAEIYARIRSKLPDLDNFSFEVLRNLAYYDRFDLHYAVENSYLEDAATAKSVIGRNEKFFKKGKFTLSMNDDIKNDLDHFNHEADRNTYDKKKNLVRKIWEEYSQTLHQRLSNATEEQSALQSSAMDLNSSKEFGKARIEQLKSRTKEIDKQMLDLKSQGKSLQKRRSLFNPVANFAIMVILIFLGIIINRILGGFVTNNWITSGIFILSGLFGIFGLILIIRVALIRRNANELSSIEARMKEIHDEKVDIKKELKKLESEINKTDAEIKEMYKQIDRIGLKIEELNGRLNESYIF